MSAAGEPAPEPAYGWYGDDFTGATDTLSTIARRGQRAFLFLDVPSKEHLAAVGSLHAIGIAGAARTMTPEQMREKLPAIGRFFADRGVRLLHYKCCSTFDSAPEVGNLAVAIEILRGEVANPLVPIVGGQPSLGRYCAFSNLFAAAGEIVHRLDRHPTMSRHPATPMTEADLVRHFAALGLPDVAAIHWPALVGGNLETKWQQAASAGAGALLLDVLDDRQLEAIGVRLRRECASGSTLVVGASSVAEAWFRPGIPEAPAPAVEAERGPVLAVVGSLSPVTRGQMAAAKAYRVLDASPEDLTSDSNGRAGIIAACLAALAEGRNVMVSTAPRQEHPPVALARGLAQATATLVDEVVRRSRVKRVAVAGGDTSSAVTSALGFWGLAYHGLAARGVTICRGRSDDGSRDGMMVLLKGGQMGDTQIFDRFAG
jgi:uncharacterized protein YgbK (DUF1537 family)